MGWLWGSSSESTDKLDSSLRDFLAKEAPSGPKPSLPSKPAPKAAEPAKPAQDETPTAPIVPPQSQFQDGRYAHLWKNYTPQHILEDRGKSEQDRLRDIVDVYNERKGDIGRVAMENCALEYLEQFECFKNPSWMQAATVCRTESRKFNRCYDIQVKFLKALGYLTMDTRSSAESERIQMHADKLYQQLVEQEALIEKAKEEGKPLPKFDSVLSKQNLARALADRQPNKGQPAGAAKPVVEDEDHVWSHIRAESRKEYEKKLATLPPEEQEIERQALLGELRAQTGMAKKVEVTFVEERINRMKRREAGQATIGDTIKRLWGWG
jgi:hypothetical protein